MMVSIAMATYNGERFIREQLESILMQTVQDFELIVCDDNSQDSTWQILIAYAQKDERIEIHHNTENIGFKRNFEQAIGLCKGDYIALADQDDIWETNHLELLLQEIGEYDMCCGNSMLVDEKNQPLGRNMSDSDGIEYIPDDERKWLMRTMLTNSSFQGASMLLKKDFAQQCLPIPNGVRFHDSWIVGCACVSQGGMHYFFQSITRYRQHTENVTHRQYRDRQRTKKENLKRYAAGIYNGIFRRDQLATDRYNMIEALRERFVADKPQIFNPYFPAVYTFLQHSRKHHLRIEDLCFLWKNIYDITTSKNKKAFFSKWFLWTHNTSV